MQIVFITVTVFLGFAATALSSAAPMTNDYTEYGKCPKIYPGDPTTFLYDADDCNVFYICDHSGPVKFNCPKGLYFSPTNLVCDFPASAGCKAGY